MKTMVIRASMLAALVTGISFVSAQEVSTSMRDYLAPEKSSRNVFEDPKGESPAFDGIKVSVGGDFALQFQGLDHSTKAPSLGVVTGTTTPNTLQVMGKDFNLPTANLDVNAYLAKGLKMHLRTYLSARHHNEAWVKGGYIQVDNLDFIKEGFAADIMKYARVKVGMDEINYGDTHFRRTDNAKAINNPFVGNYIMDSFTTEAFGEAYGFYKNFIGMVGVSNGKLNQTPVKGTSWNSPSVYAKIGYDKQISQDLRVRLTGSFIQTNGLTTGGNLYSADRAGSRYYYVLLTQNDLMGMNNQSTGRFNPGFKKVQAVQVNPFIKYQGLEFFGVYEYVSGNKASGLTERTTDGAYTQLGAELLYRFGGAEQFYFGGRYNSVSGKDDEVSAERKIDRFNLGGGWFMTKNVLAKVEYVNQKYNDDAVWGATSALRGGKFNGIMFEATIGF
ncbi:hypothetical protein [Chryseobacterium salivictor]|uniref:Phosphate-selective porin O and P n=1 Tax=Chryseobacterium salivictor TaxID=2547600 RepID=A0A4P6ZH26_9FLAO|nr:hypothetical protein [Chryseobacterium salivictor]QBO58929.1 hypothetical protein NBC122_02122 [Chryseobacterium salivictor]